MKYRQARLWLLLTSSLLSGPMSWAQNSSVGLNDLNLVLGAEPYSTKDYLLAQMDSFAATHRLQLLITLLDQEDVYTAYARQDEDALLAQTAPALVITTWHQEEGKYYQRCEVQLNEALATRLPEATAQQLVEEMLNYYGKGDMMAQDAMHSGLTVALLKLSEYLNALPPPEAVPTITFANAPAVGNQPALGLDALTEQVHQDHYEQVRINEEPYAVAWKALPSGGTTSVLTQVEKGVSFPPGVVFRQNGNTLSSQPATQNHQQQLTLTGQMHEQEGSLEVYASREEDAALVGKLRTISYDVLYKRLVLVVLDDVTSDMLYLDRVSRAVQATLAQAGVSLTIEIQKFDTEWVDREVPLEDETSGMLSNYPQELKRVIKDYRQEHEQESETAYIFLAGSSSTGKLGYMPKKRPYGFVYLNAHYYAKEVAKTIAHELGHGLFRLEHTFEAYPALVKGSTDNLMDYGKGTRLHKYQWDLVHDPKAMLGWFQDEEEGASYDCPKWFSQDDDCESVGKVLRNIRNTSANNGELITYGATWKRELVAFDIEIEGVVFSKIKIINMVEEGKDVSYFPKDYQDFSQTYLTTEGKTEILDGFILQTLSSVSSDGRLTASIPAVKVLLYEDADVFKERKEFLRKYLFGNKNTRKVATKETFDKEKTVKEKVDAMLTHATTATKVGDKFTKATACNICVRAALYLIKSDSALFPTDGSSYHDPNDNYEAREIKGYITSNGNAKRIKEDFDNLAGKPRLNERFTEVKKTEQETWREYFKRLQDEADTGEILVGVMLSSKGEWGHVIMIMPGGLVKIDEKTQEWGESFIRTHIDKLPRVLECGGQNRNTQAPLCTRVDRKGAQERLKWFRYTQ